MSLLSLSIRSSGTDRETWSRNFVTWSTTCCFQLSCYAYVPTCTSTTWDVTKRPTPYHRNVRNFDMVVERVRPCGFFSMLTWNGWLFLSYIPVRPSSGPVCLWRPSKRTNSVIDVNICVLCSTVDVYADVLHPECCIFLHCYIMPM